MKLAHGSLSTLAVLFGCASLTLFAPGCGDDDDTTATGGAANKGGGGGATARGGATNRGGTTGAGGSTTAGGTTTGTGGATGGAPPIQGGYAGEIEGGGAGAPTGGGDTKGGSTGAGGSATGGGAPKGGAPSNGGTASGGTASGGVGGAKGGGTSAGGTANGGSANGGGGGATSTGGTASGGGGGVTASGGGGGVTASGGTANGGGGGVTASGGVGGGGSQPFNLIADGGVELGSSKWSGSGATYTQVTTKVHSGTYSAKGSARTAAYSSPAIDIPAGAGTYSVSLWYAHDGTVDLPQALTANAVCDGAQKYYQLGTTTGPVGQWVEITGTLTLPAGCSTARLYVNQSSGTTYPDIYLDDVVVKPTAVTNLIGNIGFETDIGGWSPNFGAALVRTTTVRRTGNASGIVASRTAGYMGPALYLPTGAGTYTVGVWGYQSSGTPLAGAQLIAAIDYGAANPTYATVFTTTLPSATWTEFAGTLTINAGAKSVQLILSQTSATPFPDLYVDDARAAQVLP